MTPQKVTIHPPQKFSSMSTLPKVELMGMQVVVNGKRLSLSRKGRAYRVVRTFFASSQPALTSSEIIDALDKEEGMPKALSDRAKISQHSALVRMMSRIREEFNQAFRAMTPEGTSWFHYDRARNKWVLFKMPATGADGLVY